MNTTTPQQTQSEIDWAEVEHLEALAEMGRWLADQEAAEGSAHDSDPTRLAEVA